MEHRHGQSEDRPARRTGERPRADHTGDHRLLGIQRTAGNRAATAYVQREKLTSSAIVHENRQLTPDAAATEKLLDRVIAELGWSAATAWAERFITADVTADFKYGTDLDLTGRCRQRLRNEMQRRRNMAEDLTGPLGRDLGDVVFASGRFITRANEVTTELLKRSETQLKGEMAHYGLKENTFLGITTSYSMDDGPLQTGLRDAARRLAGKRTETDRVSAAFTAADKAAADDTRKIELFLPGISPSVQAREAARKAWVAAEDEYHAACAREQVEYPVLAAYTKQDDAATRLFDLVGKSKQGLAASLYSTIDERLKSIKEVREAIGTKDYNPWKHSRVVGLTKTQMALAPWEARIVDERAAASAKGADASMVAKIAAVVSIGLGLLGAIPSGGGTLLAGLAMASAAVGAAFSLNNLYEHYKDYSLAKAENMMSLDQAQAISTDEPGLLWLALDLIDLGLSFTGAMDAFKKLRTAMALVEKGGVKAMIGLNAEMGRAALPPTTRGRLFAALFEKLGGGKSAAEALEQLLAQIAAAAEKDGARQALAKAVDGAAVNLVAGKKIAFYLPGNAGGTLGEFKRIVRASGQVPAAEVEAHAIALMRDFGRKNYHGFYSGRGDFIILRAGDDMASALTHELAHRAQSVKGRLQSLGTLRAEFQSHRMQREMLLALPEEIVAKSASKELVHKTDEEIIAFLKQHPEYGPKIKVEAADASIADIDPAGDAKMVEDWFLDGTVGK